MAKRKRDKSNMFIRKPKKDVITPFFKELFGDTFVLSGIGTFIITSFNKDIQICKIMIPDKMDMSKGDKICFEICDILNLSQKKINLKNIKFKFGDEGADSDCILINDDLFMKVVSASNISRIMYRKQYIKRTPNTIKRSLMHYILKTLNDAIEYKNN